MDFFTPYQLNLFRQNTRQVVRELGLLKDAYYEIGVTLAERHLLIEISAFPRLTIGKVAENLLLEKSSASRLVAKAHQKGFLSYIPSTKDKRKKYLHLTELGQRTLQAFEEKAFEQTQHALSQLTPAEIEQVYAGMSHYSKGLKAARALQNPSKNTDQNRDSNPLLDPHLVLIQQQLQQKNLFLRKFNPQDESGLYHIYKDIIDQNNQFPYECNSLQEFYVQFLGPRTHLFVCHNAQNQVIGGFYLKANYSGRCSHIANAAYLVDQPHRGKGIGGLLVQASLIIAKFLKFSALQFNMVLAQNIGALKLYERLGFKKVGIIPDGVRNQNGSFQDGYILYQKLS